MRPRIDAREGRLPKSLRKDPARRFLFQLADRLKKTVGELEETMTLAEFHAWGEFHRLKAEDDRKNMDKAERDAKAKAAGSKSRGMRGR
jgi:hypothetical protein